MTWYTWKFWRFAHSRNRGAWDADGRWKHVFRGLHFRVNSFPYRFQRSGVPFTQEAVDKIRAANDAELDEMLAN